MRAERAAYDRRLGRSALDDFVRLFWLGLSMAPERAGRALGTYDLDAALADGLLERAGDEVRSALVVKSYGGVLVAADRTEVGVDRDHVIGVNPTAMTLAGLTVRGPVGSLLDVGTGGGVQALLAACDAKEVTAVDVNPRALAFARFNAHLNGVDNVTWLQGDRFAPVAGRRFDRVVSNPPYVISPDSAFAYRDGGMAGDAMSESVVRGAAAHLAEDGFATVLCNWAQRLDEPWHERVRAWADGCGCDVLVVRFSSTVPAAYALTWNGHLQDFDEVVDRWIRYYDDLGIEAIGDGGVIMRRRSGANWFRTLDVDDPRVGRCSEELLDLFAGVDTALRPDEELLRLPFALTDDMRLVDTTVAATGEHSVRLVRGGGLGMEAGLDAPSLHLIQGCTGDRPLGAVLDDVATTFGIDAAEAADVGLAVARRMLGLGFLAAATAPAVRKP